MINTLYNSCNYTLFLCLDMFHSSIQKLDRSIKDSLSHSLFIMSNGYVNRAMTDENVEPTSPDSDYDELFEIPDVEYPSGLANGQEPVSLDNKDELDESGIHARPFKTIHNPPLSFKAVQRKVFIPHTEIKVTIRDVERSVTTHLLNPNLYTIELKHGDFTWTVCKRYKQFQALHQQLKLFRAGLNIPFPSRAHRERRTSFRNSIANESGGKKRHSALPRFPSKPEALVPYEEIEHRKLQLQEYLNALLKIKLYKNHHETVNFLEVSHVSFVDGLGMKGKEGLVLKRTGSTQTGRSINFCGIFSNNICVRCGYMCSDICDTWRHRWLFVKDTYLGYIRPKDGRVKCVMLFDSGFEVSSGIYSTGMHNGLQIVNHSRQIIVKCWTRRKRKEWLTYLKEVASGPARDFILHNRFNSFAPIRPQTDATWFVDGCSYMEAVADALESAKEEIFIADWWLSPEIYMKRPVLDGDMWRLDKILERKASEGVKIFVMLYKEVELALGINSYYSKQKLVTFNSENIKVLRHPDHAKAGVFFWAHHEKIVVIDQTYAFLGGIDLCYGRWDDHEHRLTDLGSVSQTLAAGSFLPQRKKHTSSRPLGDSNLPQSILHLAHATNLVGVGALGGSRSSLESSTVPSESTKPLNELEPNEQKPVKCNTPETERKNIIRRMRESTDQAWGWLSRIYHGSEDNDDEEKCDSDSVTGVECQIETYPNSPGGKRKVHYKEDQSIQPNGEIVSHHIPVSKSNSLATQLSGMSKFWIGKDYSNFIVRDFQNLDMPYQDLVDRNTTPRMPWHDIGVMVQGAAARDVARHFIQRWNSIKLEKAKLNPLYPYLLPKSYEGLQTSTILKIIDNFSVQVECQVVRSAARWSTGFLDHDTWEESIHEAYLDAITKAEHYIYIENQFFISLSYQSNSVRNQIGETLFRRIVKAHKEGTVFRVFVVMPLLPGFEGEVGTAKGSALHAITHWNYSSISNGKEAILNRLKVAGVTDPSQYISFYGLRTHSSLHGSLVSELIYVHSKLLIADDKLVICGSANINDRSMVGRRDSEIAVVLKDTEFEDGIMNGLPYNCGKYAGSLRKYLFKEHLGILETKATSPVFDISDPISEQFYRHTWMRIAAENGKIYEGVFRCIPSDQATSFHKMKKFQEEIAIADSDPVTAGKMLENVQGHLVTLPLDFLKREILTPNPNSVEGILPTSLWT